MTTKTMLIVIAIIAVDVRSRSSKGDNIMKCPTHTQKFWNDDLKKNVCCENLQCNIGEEPVVCSGDSNHGSCRACPKGTYQNERTSLSDKPNKCKKKTVCEHVAKYGTTYSDNTCACPPDRLLSADGRCIPRKLCSPGYGQTLNGTMCERCVEGKTFSSTDSNTPCIPVTNCTLSGMHTIRTATIVSDSVCYNKTEKVAPSKDDIIVQQGPVKVKQGSNVRLWCKLKQMVKNKAPVHWESPPTFLTRTLDCNSYAPVKEKYVTSCSDTWDHFRFYNITIMDVQWADKGQYRCTHTSRKGIVELDVLVPVTNVSLTHVPSRKEELRFLGKDENAVLTCTTNCANPAPKVSWLENNQPIKSNAIAEADCTGKKKGQKRTISTVTVYANKEKKQSNVSCTATNVKGETNVSRFADIRYKASMTGVCSENTSAFLAGTVQVKQGDNICLWCKVINDGVSKEPVHWRSPPNFATRTSNCVSFVKEKYAISCGKDLFMWYNMTIMNVQWEDKGKYQCFLSRQLGTVDLQVLVPVKNVSLTIGSSSEEEHVLTCTTNCACPAPIISWFENDQPFNGSVMVKITDVGCTGDEDGQKRTISTVTVRGKYGDEERKESTIACTAANAIGEKNISKAIAITYVASTLSQHAMYDASTVVPVVLSVLVIATIAIVIVVRRKKLAHDLNCLSRRSVIADNEVPNDQPSDMARRSVITDNEVPNDQPSEITPMLYQEMRTWRRLKKLKDVRFPDDRSCKTVCRIKHLKNGTVLATLAISNDENENADTIYFHDANSSTLTDKMEDNVNPTDDVAVLSSDKLVAPTQKKPIIRVFTPESGAFRDIELKRNQLLKGKLRYIATNDSDMMFVLTGFLENDPHLLVVESDGNVIQSIQVNGVPHMMAFCTQNSILYIATDRRIRRFHWENNSLVELESSKHPDEEFECKDVSIGSAGEVFVTGRLQSNVIQVYQMEEEQGEEEVKFLWKNLAFQDGKKRKGDYPRICSRGNNVWLGYHEKMEKFELV